MLKIVRADISKLKSDAIVNCASSNPTIGETRKFLAHAGLALSPSNLRDLIIGDFISRGDYHQEALDMVLCNEQQKQLFGTFGE